MLTSLEESVLAHPYYSSAVGVGVLVAFVIAIKRFINSDVDALQSHGYEYARLQKTSSRLD